MGKHTISKVMCRVLIPGSAVHGLSVQKHSVPYGQNLVNSIVFVLINFTANRNVRNSCR
jgi:hypothetical protein